MLDVIIVTYNRPIMVSEILDMLECQDSPVNVIISDDGGDCVLDWRRYTCVGKYLWTKHFGYQRVARYNEALKYVANPGVVFLDDDVVPQGTSWSKAFEAQLDAKTAVIRGLHVTDDGSLALPPWFSTTNVCFNTPIMLNVIRGLDMRYNGNYGYEDLDMGILVEKKALLVTTGTPETAAKHKGIPRRGNIDINKKLYCEKWGLA